MGHDWDFEIKLYFSPLKSGKVGKFLLVIFPKSFRPTPTKLEKNLGLFCVLGNFKQFMIFFSPLWLPSFPSFDN